MRTMIERNQKLVAVAMPSGLEEPQREVLKEMAHSMGYETRVDGMGNLYCKKGGWKEGETSKYLVGAAMDVKGLLATRVDEKGFVKFHGIGAIEAGKLIHSRVRFENGVKGTLNCRWSGESDTQKLKDMSVSDLYADLGAMTAEEVEQLGIETGMMAVVDQPVVELRPGYIRGPHGDHLVGCLALLETMDQRKDAEDTSEITFAFLVQHHSGRNGIRTAVQQEQPEYTFLVRAAEAKTSPDGTRPVEVEVGKGPVIRFRENLQSTEEEICMMLTETAKKIGIPWQAEALNRDKSGVMEAQVSGKRTMAAFVGVPVQAIGSPTTTYREDDVKQCGTLLAAVCR